VGVEGKASLEVMSFIVVIDDRPEKRRQYLTLASSIGADVNIEGFATS
jgi:hypothetical protein